ncbi:MAG: hypothetical protein LBO06_03590 [Bacteroidales bacterium]|jgi:hypothetical protein|nr:hypothetical protein [Bacteroidales bacterium]
MKYIVAISRFIFGAVFMFSGFVKAVDPYGTAYKMEEYLNVFGMSSWFEAMPWIYIVTSVGLCCLEFVVGFIVFFHLCKRTSFWLAGLMMLYFTILTLIDALTNQVSDCGCFGDAIKLTNWETFWKNVGLDVLLIIVIIFEKRKKVKPQTWKGVLVLFVAGFAVGFSIYNAMYEPCLDFREWAVGNQMILPKAEQKPMESYATYLNNETNKEKEFNMEELMEIYNQDTTFKANWTFVSSRVLNPNEVKADGFSMGDLLSNEDKSFEFLSQEDTLYLIPCLDLNEVSDKAAERTIAFAKSKIAENKPVALITATLPSQWITFIDKYKADKITIYSTDDKAIKTIARSSIAVVELFDGKVISKKSWRSLPQ